MELDNGPIQGAGTVYLVTFSSLSMILLTFFIFLNSIAHRDAERERKILREIALTFASPSAGDELLAVTRQDSRNEEAFKSIALASKELGFQTDARENSVIVLLPVADAFEKDGDQLAPRMIVPLRDLGRVIRDFGLTAEIEAHADDAPRNTLLFSSSLERSAAWAMSMYRFLLDIGVPASHLSAGGVGASRPAFDNTTESGRQQNRRVVITIRNRHESKEAQ